MHDALHERLGRAVAAFREDLDVVRAQVGVAEPVDRPDKRHHELVARALVQLARRPRLLDTRLVDDDDLLCQLHRLLLIMRDEDRRHVDLLVQPAQPVAQLGTNLHVERTEGLIEQQHLRLHRQRARKGHALQLTARELRGIAPREALQAHQREQLLHARIDLAARAPPDGQPEGDVAGHRHVLEGRVVLEHEAHAAAARGRIGDVLAADAHDAGVGALQAGDDAQQRRLAAPARAQHGGERAVGDADAHVLQRGERAEALAHVADLDRHYDASRACARRASRLIASSVPSASRASTSAAA